METLVTDMTEAEVISFKALATEEGYRLSDDCGDTVMVKGDSRMVIHAYENSEYEVELLLNPDTITEELGLYARALAKSLEGYDADVDSELSQRYLS